MTKNTLPSQTADKYVLRFPDGMRDTIAVAAKANNRTMNAEMIARLQASFAQQGVDVKTESLDLNALGEMVRLIVRDEIKQALSNPTTLNEP